MSEQEPTSSNVLESVRPAAPALFRPVAKPNEIIAARNESIELMKGVLKEGRDYGKLPGTDRQVLFKAGAELLNTSFGCYADPEILEREIDHNHLNTFDLKKWEEVPKPTDDIVEAKKAAGLGRFRKGDPTKGEPNWIYQEAQVEKGTSYGLYRFIIKVRIIHRESGVVVGSGVGACSSLESKYIRNPRDTENTILKMAKKRALVDASLDAYGLSDRFTQDVDELIEEETAPGETAAPKPAKSTAPKPAAAAADPQAISRAYGFTSDQLRELNDKCKRKGRKFTDLMLECNKANAKGFLGVLKIVNAWPEAAAAENVIEAEFKEEKA